MARTIREGNDPLPPADKLRIIDLLDVRVQVVARERDIDHLSASAVWQEIECGPPGTAKPVSNQKTLSFPALLHAKR